MNFTKEVVLPAALSEVFGRLFSFLIDSFSRPTAVGTRDVYRQRLEWMLGNISSMVEEAEGRHITNMQLLSHLKVLTEGMFRGRFTLEVSDLDDVKNTRDDDNNATCADDESRRSFALCSSFNRAKRSRVTRLIFGSSGGDDGKERLAAVIEELELLTSDYMREFILLVQGYPQKVHWPVKTTLYMDKCMFGRHVEKEGIINFLLQRPLIGVPYLSVLTVIGGKKLGKTTLVKHACDDERVRDHFARIEWFETQDVVRKGGLPGQTMWESDGPEYLDGVRHIIAEPRFSAVRSLLVFEDAWPIDEVAWSELACIPSTLTDGSKLLFTSRNIDVARLGTVEPVVLRHLPLEEYWYYFKAFAFGGTDPREHPLIAMVGREILEHLERTFLDARVLGTLLKANFDIRFWRRMLGAIARYQ
uniref:NB-ARC domain-containing protein n=1 Tax=Oryza punctata TaxID=4537 RepID=A0A0E0LF65_ORYPU